MKKEEIKNNLKTLNVSFLKDKYKYTVDKIPMTQTGAIKLGCTSIESKIEWNLGTGFTPLKNKKTPINENTKLK